jgi:type VI secretion system protein ImpF
MASDTHQEQFRRQLEAVIRRFEPRLRELTVEIIKANEETRDRTLRFRINAILDVASTSEMVIYDTVIDPVSGALSFVGGTAIG